MSSATETSENSERTEDCSEQIQEACDDAVAFNYILTVHEHILRTASMHNIIRRMKSSTRMQIANRAKSPTLTTVL